MKVQNSEFIKLFNTNLKIGTILKFPKAPTNPLVILNLLRQRQIVLLTTELIPSLPENHDFKLVFCPLEKNKMFATLVPEALNYNHIDVPTKLGFDIKSCFGGHIMRKGKTILWSAETATLAKTLTDEKLGKLIEQLLSEDFTMEKHRFT